MEKAELIDLGHRYRWQFEKLIMSLLLATGFYVFGLMYSNETRKDVLNQVQSFEQEFEMVNATYVSLDNFLFDYLDLNRSTKLYVTPKKVFYQDFLIPTISTQKFKKGYKAYLISKEQGFKTIEKSHTINQNLKDWKTVIRILFEIDRKSHGTRENHQMKLETLDLIEEVVRAFQSLNHQSNKHNRYIYQYLVESGIISKQTSEVSVGSLTEHFSRQFYDRIQEVGLVNNQSVKSVIIDYKLKYAYFKTTGLVEDLEIMKMEVINSINQQFSSVENYDIAFPILNIKISNFWFIIIMPFVIVYLIYRLVDKMRTVHSFQLLGLDEYRFFKTGFQKGRVVDILIRRPEVLKILVVCSFIIILVIQLYGFFSDQSPTIIKGVFAIIFVIYEIVMYFHIDSDFKIDNSNSS